MRTKRRVFVTSSFQEQRKLALKQQLSRARTPKTLKRKEAK